MRDDIDPEDFEPAPASVVLDRQARAPRPAHGPKPKFVKVPTSWKARLTGAHCAATYHVALELLDRSFKEHRQTIRFANVGLASIGITRRRKWQALAELKRLGLVHTDNRTGKSPMVTLLLPEDGK